MSELEVAASVNVIGWSDRDLVGVVDGVRVRIRRRGDGSELPADFDADDVRRERRTSMWWV